MKGWPWFCLNKKSLWLVLRLALAERHVSWRRRLACCVAAAAQGHGCLPTSLPASPPARIDACLCPPTTLPCLPACWPLPSVPTPPHQALDDRLEAAKQAHLAQLRAAGDNRWVPRQAGGQTRLSLEPAPGEMMMCHLTPAAASATSN